VDGPASRRKFVFGIVFLGASCWPPQIVIRYAAGVNRMPNGGSDNCGTCWFNQRNNGEAGFCAESGHCIIRGLTIEHPLWTYCNNHPKHRPQRDPIPIGPAYASDDSVLNSYRRKVWQPSPDTEEIRLHLLEVLLQIPEIPEKEYGTVYTDEVVVWQLGEFREHRAITGLRRVAAFSREARGATRARVIDFAEKALAKIEGGDPAAT
jgi:hypothetical protein